MALCLNRYFVSKLLYLSSSYLYTRRDTIRSNKHDRYLENLRDFLAPSYDSITTNLILQGKRRQRRCTLAEIDLLAKKGNHYDVYEVKCSYRITKARPQLKKIQKNLPRHFKVKNYFFYCGATAQTIKIH